MRCRFRRKIFQNESNGYTIAQFITEDTSVPLAARDKYLQNYKQIGFVAVGFDLPLTDQIQVEMEGTWEQSSHGLQSVSYTHLDVYKRQVSLDHASNLPGFSSCHLKAGWQ